MKRIWAIIRRDLLATTRDFILAYVLIAPLLLTLGARFFLPTVGQAAVNVVITPDLAAQTERLSTYFEVETVADRAALERRVRAYDDTVGIASAAGGWALVTEGDENPEVTALAATVLRQWHSAFAPAVEEIRGSATPYRELAGAIFAVSALLMAAIVMGLLIIDDKESNILMALGASPVSRREYVAARSLMAVVLTTVLAFSVVWVLGLTQFNHLQLLALAVVTGGTGSVLGFLIGAISPNQIAGLATIKFLSLLVLAPPIAALVVPQRLQFLLWWAPTYWPFRGLRAILEGGTTWGGLAPHLLGSALTALALAAILYPWLKGKLDFARN